MLKDIIRLSKTLCVHCSTSLGENLIWSTERLTRFETARLIGARTLQISLGAPILVKAEVMTPAEIAKAEFKEKIIPITVKRKMPNNEYILVDTKRAIDNWLVDHKGEI